MKKKIYSTSFKRQLVVSKALLAAKEARESLDPALLERAKQAIEGSLRVPEESYSPVAEKQQSSFSGNNVREPVDQKKNLAIVLKYLEMKPGNKALRQEIQAFLAGR